ncbi:CPBP family intramembrane metalloprotease [Prolixibacteraceae bacterium]|nr:CPBP family intramembrane metalloprotease [Prolixibacteraceae bacterium]
MNLQYINKISHKEDAIQDTSCSQKKYLWLMSLFIIVPWVVIYGICTYITTMWLGIRIDSPEAEMSSNSHFWTSLSGLFATMLTIWGAVRIIEKKKLRDIGLRINNRIADIIFGIIIAALCIIIGYIVLISTNQLIFLRTHFNLTEMVASIFFFIFGAMTEEILVRGYIQRVLMSKYNKYIALLFSSIIFTLMHGYNPNLGLVPLISLFLAGVTFGLSYLYTNNLWFPIAFHASWNFFQSLFGFNVSGISFYSVIESHTTTTTIMNGGEFGFEGSILSILFEFTIIICLFLYFHRSEEAYD